MHKARRALKNTPLSPHVPHECFEVADAVLSETFLMAADLLDQQDVRQVLDEQARHGCQRTATLATPVPLLLVPGMPG